MKRIATPNCATDLFGAGKNGFRKAIPGIASATEFSDTWFNHVQEAIVRTIEAAGLELSDADHDQFTAALATLSADRCATAGGTPDAITGEFFPRITELTDSTCLYVRAASANTTSTPTFKADATPALTIVKGNNLPLAVGDIAGEGHWLALKADPALGKYVLQNPARGIIVPESIPVGTVSHVAMSSPPAGWLKANGAAVSRTIYASLYAAIGTTFGTGDGSTTFNLPDLRGEFIRGWDDGRGVDAGRGIGTAQANEIQSHRHSKEVRAYSFTGVDLDRAYAGSGSGIYTNYTGYSGGSETRPRNIALLACIKY